MRGTPVAVHRARRRLQPRPDRARQRARSTRSMLGLPRKEARERFDDIIAFAELEEFVDLKLKNYSSGMSVRLAFAVAIQVDADVLLVDEVLAVGDAAFQQKCFDEFQRLQGRGHDDPASSRTTWARSSASATARCCWRSGGDRRIGGPDAIAAHYSELNFGRRRTATPRPRRDGDQRRAEIDEVVRGRGRRARRRGAAGRALRVALRGALQRAGRGPDLRAHAAQRRRHTVFARRTAGAARRDRRLARRRGACRAFALRRAGPSRYTLTPSVARDGAERRRARPPRGPRARSSCTLASPAASSTSRTRSRSSAGMSADVAARAARRPVAIGGDLRRFWSLTLDARRHRVQAALLRLGARLPVVAGAPADAVRRALRRLHPGRAARRGRPALPGLPAQLDRAVHVLRGGDERLRDCLVDRENLLRKIRFPRMVIPLSVALTALFNLGMNLIARARVLPARRASSRRWTWLGLPCSWSRCSCFALGIAMLLSRAVRALPRHAADLGGRAARCCSTARR